jgi:hypothetical protein
MVTMPLSAKAGNAVFDESTDYADFADFTKETIQKETV